MSYSQKVQIRLAFGLSGSPPLSDSLRKIIKLYCNVSRQSHRFTIYLSTMELVWMIPSTRTTTPRSICLSFPRTLNLSRRRCMPSLISVAFSRSTSRCNSSLRRSRPTPLARTGYHFFKQESRRLSLSAASCVWASWQSNNRPWRAARAQKANRSPWAWIRSRLAERVSATRCFSSLA